MKYLILPVLLLMVCFGCRTSIGNESPPPSLPPASLPPQTVEPPSQQHLNPGRVIHVLVALCDNQYQGIVPVPARIGNGDDPPHNLYWGCEFGVKTHLKRAQEWKVVSENQSPKPGVLERVIFQHRTKPVFLVADAYQGREIKQCTLDLLRFAAGGGTETIAIPGGSSPIYAGGSSHLLAYVGHDGLMDFQLDAIPQRQDQSKREVMILACASQRHFSDPLKQTGAQPLLWTTGLMAPEAYVLKAGIDGWIANESGEAIRSRAAKAYNTYQNCGMKGAMRLFATGW